MANLELHVQSVDGYKTHRLRKKWSNLTLPDIGQLEVCLNRQALVYKYSIENHQGTDIYVPRLVARLKVGEQYHIGRDEQGRSWSIHHSPNRVMRAF